MKTISLSSRSRDKNLHIEAPGCIINIQFGLTDTEGRDVTFISVSADGNRYSGDPCWWLEGVEGKDGMGIRVVREGTKP